jgi:phosphatidylglycerophosphate synthase
VMLSPPQVLIAFRAACAPAIFVLACFGFAGPVLAAVLMAGFVSDVVDGIVARRMGIATPDLRRADTLVDTAFYTAAAFAVRLAVPAVFAGCALPLSILFAVHVSRSTFELTKFGRLAAYHLWSSKVLGVAIVTMMTTVLLTARPLAIVGVVLWAAVLNELEGFMTSAILPVWTPDVPSLVHGLRRSRPQ